MLSRSAMLGIGALVLLCATAAAAYWTAVGSPAVLEPGERSTAHASIDCLRCHQTYEGIADDRCLECHGTASNWTWHTLSGGGKQCAKCHYEHVGRDRLTDLTRVPPCPRGENLSESHDGLRCVECHRSGAPTEECAPCHERYRAGTHLVGYSAACDGCHDQTDWKTSYDHDAPPTPERPCADCHGKEPPHALDAYLEWSEDCDVCHGTASWPIPVFPHETIREPCDACHPATLNPTWGGTATNCSDCHTLTAWTPPVVLHERLDGTCGRCHESLSPAKHLTRSERGYLDCRPCHGNVTWARAIDHEDYKAPCVQCHLEDQDKHSGPFARDCQWCHGVEHWAVAVTHPAQEAACLDCHVDPHVGGNASAHVDAAHSAVCAACHVGGVNWTVIAVDHAPLGSDCAACHAAPHAAVGAGAVACGECHATDRWVPLVVDHDLFGLDCASCHATTHPNAWDRWSEQCTLCHVVDDWRTRSYDHGISNETAVPCVNCHDDVHRGTLGIVCEECHAVDTWETEVINP